MALSAGRNFIRKEGHLTWYKMKASSTIYKGGLVVIADSTGLAEAGVGTATGFQFVGVADETVTSTASGGEGVHVWKTGEFDFTLTSVADAHIGQWVSISDDATVVAALPTLTTVLTGTNNDLTFTAKEAAGTGAEAITITYLDPGTASATASCECHGYGIVFNLATDTSGTITTTGDNIKTLLAANAAANALVSAADVASNDGSGAVTAMASSQLITSAAGAVCGIVTGKKATNVAWVRIDRAVQ